MIIDEFGNAAPLESKEYERLKNVSLLFFYGWSKKTPIEKGALKWHHDPNSVLKKTFTDSMQIYKYIVIHPDGNFNSSSYVRSFTENKKLLKPKSFSKLDEKCRKKLKNIINASSP